MPLSKWVVWQKTTNLRTESLPLHWHGLLNYAYAHLPMPRPALIGRGRLDGSSESYHRLAVRKCSSSAAVASGSCRYRQPSTSSCPAGVSRSSNIALDFAAAGSAQAQGLHHKANCCCSRRKGHHLPQGAWEIMFHNPTLSADGSSVVKANERHSLFNNVKHQWCWWTLLVTV